MSQHCSSVLSFWLLALLSPSTTVAMALALPLWQEFLDLPTLARISRCSKHAISAGILNQTQKNLLELRRKLGRGRPTTNRLRFSSMAQELWAMLGHHLFALDDTSLRCPGLIEEAYVQVWMLGLHHCDKMGEASQRALASVCPHAHSRPLANTWADASLEGWQDDNFGDALVQRAARRMLLGSYDFKLYSPAWACCRDAAEWSSVVLEFNVFGFVGVVIFTESDPYE